MVSNPMRDPAVTVGVSGDASSLNSALDGAVAKLGSLRNAVGLAGAALGALAVGGLAKATGAAADFEEQMVEVEKVTTPETAEAMSQSIREMAAEMPVAQEELAGIAAQAGRFGVEGPENIERFTESVAKMAVATDLSTEEAGEAFARMSTLMDEPIENVENLGDAVNELSNTMATSASEITNASTRSSGALSQLGLQSDEILALNATMNEVSASSRIAGTRLRRFAQELQDPGKAEDLAAALGMTVDEFRAMRENDPNQLMQEMVQRFNEGDESADELRSTLSTTSRSALAGLAQNTEGWADAQQVANDQLGDGTSLTEEYAAAADTFNSKVQVLKNRIKNAAIAIGEDLLPIMTQLVEAVTGAFDIFEGLNEQFDTNVGTIGLVSVAIGGLTAALIAFAPAAAAAAASMAAIAAPALAIAAVVAALWIAWEENLFGMQEVVDDVVGEIEPLFEDVMDIFDDLLGVAEDVFEGITEFIEDNQEAFESVFDGIQNAISGVVDFVQEILLPAVRFAFGVFTDSVQPVIRSLKQNLGPVLDEVGQTMNAVVGHAETAGDVMLAIWNSIDQIVVPIVETVASVIGDTLGYVIDQLAQGMMVVMNLIQGDFGGALENLKAMLGNTIDAAFDIVGAISDGISAAVDWLVRAGMDLLLGAFDFAKEGGLTAMLVDAIVEGLEDMAEWLSSRSADAIEWLGELTDKIKQAVIDGLTLGLLQGPSKQSIEQAGELAEERRRRGQQSGTVTTGRQPTGEGLNLPGGATGGFINRSGVMAVHAGERVVPAAQVTDRGEVTVEAGGAGPRALASAVRSALSGAALVVQTGDETLERVVDEQARLVFEDQAERVDVGIDRMGRRSPR